MSVGNLSFDSEVLIKVIYISEFGVEGDGIVLIISVLVVSWVRDIVLV